MYLYIHLLIRFGPNPLLDETPTEIWTASGLDKNINHWDKVSILIYISIYLAEAAHGRPPNLVLLF